MPKKLFVQGLDNIPEPLAAVCRSRLLNAINKLLEETKLENINVSITTKEENQANNNAVQAKKKEIDLTPEDRAKRYKAVQPLFSFEQLVISKPVEEDLLLAVDLIEKEKKIFDEWGLRKIEPFPRTALNFHGKPGTGKTLAAHALASKINHPILVASYAQIESMYHGEGPKNVEAIFLAAEKDNALLFIDEADSLLSRRLTNVTQGSEQAINSMRSQLLICLERFKGIVIFSTNLVTNYDKAFETRVRNIHFPMPDEMGRQKIWQNHLPPELPLANNVSVEEIAKIDDVCGRDIKNAVLDAAMRAARQSKERIDLEDFIQSIKRIKAARIQETSDSEQKLTPQEKQEIKEKIKEHLANKPAS
jgi:ATP-dependent 26S proteasome regulatory subunit